MNKLLQTLMDGVAVGSLYALIALGYTMVYGVLQFINFAHGDVVMVGAWICFLLVAAAGLAVGEPQLGALYPADWIAIPLLLGMLALLMARVPRRCLSRWPQTCHAVELAATVIAAVCGIRFLLLGGGWAGYGLHGAAASQGWTRLAPALGGAAILVTAMCICAVLGYLFERLAYRPLRDAPRLNVLITAIGLSLLIQNVGQLKFVFGTEPQAMAVLLPDVVLVEVAGVSVRLLDVGILTTTILLMASLDYLVFRTKIGTAMRAASFDRHTAALMGIPVDRVVTFTFVMGSALAAAGGFLFVSKYRSLQQPADMAWVLMGLKAFVAAVVGGIGNIRGAMVGGLLIGLLEFFGAAYLSPQLRDVYVFTLLIAMLLLRPSGLFGRHALEKV